MGETLLEGKLVRLRPKRPEDASLDYSWRIDKELATLDASHPLRMSFQEYLQFYKDEMEYPAPTSWRFAIETLEGRHIGNCMLYDMDFLRGEAELGILIGDKAYWGNGYGTEAVRTLTDYAFTATNMQRIYLHTLDWNIRAQRCFSKCGFVATGTVRRLDNTLITMELRRAEWAAGAKEKTSAIGF